jgi:type IV pilus assembly protein PilW
MGYLKHRQSGLSLIELIIALTIGAFLVLGVVNILVSNKRSSQIETSLARLQESGRSAMDLLVGDINAATYIGCNSTTNNLSVMAKNVEWTAVQGYERNAGSWSPALPAKLNDLANVARPGSDLLNLQHIRPAGLTLDSAVTPSSTAVAVTANPQCLSENDLVVVSSCVTAHLFRITNEPACGGSATTLEFDATGNDITSMQPGYDTDDQIMRFFDKTWFVADTGRVRTEADIPVYALFRRANGETEEMIEGVEYLQITYGQQVGGGNIRYIPADDANLDLDDVVSVRIALLIQSFEPVLNEADSQVYQLLDESIGDGQTFEHNAGRTLRRVFRTTVLLRNRAVGA